MSDLYLRGSIRPEIENKAFIKGCKIAGASVLMVACSEFILPLLEFESLGIWSWLVGSSATSIGLFPYRKMKNFQKRPDILHADLRNLSLLHRQKPLFSIPWDQVESFYYLDSGTAVYGLAFTLKQPVKNIPMPLVLKCRKAHGVDLFLPYFSHSSFLLLENWFNQNLQDSELQE